MKAIALLLTLAATPAAFAQIPDGELKVRPEQLKLKYQSYEGEFTYACKASFVSDVSPYDFRVRCYDDKQSLKREFTVHLAITQYTRTIAPRMRLEILYWVDGEGATSWLSFAEPNPMVTYQSSQSIKGEQSSLLLELAIPTLNQPPKP